MKSLLGFKARAQTAVRVCRSCIARKYLACFDVECMLSFAANKISLLRSGVRSDRCRSSSTGFLHRAAETNQVSDCSQPRFSPKTYSKVVLQDQSLGALCTTVKCRTTHHFMSTGGLEPGVASSESGQHRSHVILQLDQGEVPSIIGC